MCRTIYNLKTLQLCTVHCGLHQDLTPTLENLQCMQKQQNHSQGSAKRVKRHKKDVT